MDLKVLVNGVDLTAQVRLESIDVQGYLTKQIDTASFVIDDVAHALTINAKQEVIISNSEETVRYFGGYVGRKGLSIEGLMRVWSLTCQDWSVRMDRIMFDDTFEDMTDAAIIAAVFGAEWAAVDVATYVDVGVTVERLICEQSNLRQLMDELCRLSGFVWKLDYDLALHYYDPASPPAASFSLSSSPDLGTSFPLKATLYDGDGTNIVNKVLIKGFEATYGPAQQYYGGGATQKVFNLGRQWIGATSGDSIFSVEAYPGGVYHAYSVGIKGVDTFPTVECLWDADTMTLEFDHAPIYGAYEVRIYGRYTVKVEKWVSDAISIALYGQILEGLITDTSITTESMAVLVGESFLVDNAYELEQLQVMCWEDGLSVGELLTVVDAPFGINGTYLIQGLGFQILGNEIATYRLDLGAFRPDLNDILLALQGSVSGLSSGRIGGTATGASYITLTTALSNDKDYSGIVVPGTAGEAFSAGAPIYLSPVDETWYETDADIEAKSDAEVGIAIDDAIMGGSVSVLKLGYYRLDTWTWNTAIRQVYLSTTAGELTQTAPSGGEFVRIFGHPFSATILEVNPNTPYIETQ